MWCGIEKGRGGIGLGWGGVGLGWVGLDWGGSKNGTRSVPTPFLT